MDEFTWLQADSQYVRTEHGTLVIGLSFIFLAYMLHPIVDSAYQRVRAYRAWRAIENHDRVEVTSYPMAAELCGGRGKWDAARIITVLLLAFSLASWILELSLGLKTIEGNVELLTLAPSIFKKNGDSNSAWQVRVLGLLLCSMPYPRLVISKICVRKRARTGWAAPSGAFTLPTYK